VTADSGGGHPPEGLAGTRATHYRFQELRPGVVFAEARTEGTALSNAGIVDLGGSTLVIDTGLTLRAARELRRVALERTGRAPSITANSHWHLDHLLGNQLFSDGPIYATRGTVEVLLRKRAQLERDLTLERLEAELREIQGQAPRAAGAPTPAERREYALALRLNRALWEEAVDLRLTPPSISFEESIELPGDRKARLVTFGGGHTNSDALLWLPSERLLFAGDLVVAGSHPNLLSGDPDRWLRILTEIERLRPERIATGHGPVGDLETVAAVRDYLTTLARLAQESGTPEVPVRFRAWEGPSQFLRNLEFLRGRRLAPPT
jgi:cyclase